MMPALQPDRGVTLRSLLIDLIEPAKLVAVGLRVVDGIAQDSREVGPNYLFIAVSGAVSHGLEYVEEAVAAGATVILCDESADECRPMLDAVDEQVLCLQLEGLKNHIGQIASRFFGQPSRDLKLIGVTGTDGKTSVSHYLAQCLHTPASPCGLLGTLGNGLMPNLRSTGLTTASAVQVQRSLAELVAEGARTAAMEVSSHGLDQGRVDAVEFDTAVFTNLSQDHLDYHGSMEAYFEAKAKLFQLTGLRSAVVNLDDAFGRLLAPRYRDRVMLYGYSLSDQIESLAEYADHIVAAKTITPRKHGFEVDVVTPAGPGRFELNLLGRFNVSNALAVLATLLLSGLKLPQALRRLQAIRPVAGRMELIVAADRPTVIVDYAHTPQGIVAACTAAKEHLASKLWCVFGCGGDRDRRKRPLMAEAAEKCADRVIVTSDNPRHEDPQSIIAEIMTGFANPEIVDHYVDRHDAIRHAIDHAGVDDVILIAGKGHETFQLIGDQRIAFDDRRIARELLESTKHGVGVHR